MLKYLTLMTHDNYLELCLSKKKTKTTTCESVHMVDIHHQVQMVATCTPPILLCIHLYM